MRIGVISNTDSFIPFTYALASQQQQVSIFISPAKDSYLHQKVLSFVQATKIPFTEEKDKDNDLYQWLQKGNFDICFMLGYSHLIKIDRLKSINTQIFNIHFGPLPGYRGPVPVFWQLKNGIDKVGLSIHRLSAKFDDGPIVWKKDAPNLAHYNYQTVNNILGQLCVEGVFYIVQMLMQRMLLPVIANNTDGMAYQKRPGLQEVLINWNTMSATEICNLVRACNPWNRGALTAYNGQELKIMDAMVVEQPASQPAVQTPGTILEDEGRLWIQCKDNQAISVNMVFGSDCFIPAYQCKLYGILKGKKLG